MYISHTIHLLSQQSYAPLENECRTQSSLHMKHFQNLPPVADFKIVCSDEILFIISIYIATLLKYYDSDGLTTIKIKILYKNHIKILGWRGLCQQKYSIQGFSEYYGWLLPEFPDTTPISLFQIIL